MSNSSTEERRDGEPPNKRVRVRANASNAAAAAKDTEISKQRAGLMHRAVETAVADATRVQQQLVAVCDNVNQACGDDKPLSVVLANATALVDAGCVESLCAVLNISTGWGQGGAKITRSAVDALQVLVSQLRRRVSVQVVACGGLPVIAAAMRSGQLGNGEPLAACYTLLRELTSHDKQDFTLPCFGLVNTVMQHLAPGATKCVKKAACQLLLRRLTCHTQGCNRLVQAGVLPLLVGLVPEGRWEAQRVIEALVDGCLGGSNNAQKTGVFVAARVPGALLRALPDTTIVDMPRTLGALSKLTAHDGGWFEDGSADTCAAVALLVQAMPCADDEFHAASALFRVLAYMLRTRPACANALDAAALKQIAATIQSKPWRLVASLGLDVLAQWLQGTKDVPAVAALAAETDMAKTVWTVMASHHHEHSSVAASGCAVLSRLAVAGMAMADATLLAPVAEALRVCAGVPAVVEHACVVLRSCCTAASAADGLNALLFALSVPQLPEQLAQVGCATMCQLLKVVLDTGTRQLDAALALRCADVLAPALSLHTSNEAVCASATSALFDLTRLGTSALPRCEAGVLAALAQHPHVFTVAYCGCSVLALRAAPPDASLLAVLADVLRHYQTSLVIVQNACIALGRLLSADSGSVPKALDAGVTKLCVAALSRHVSDAKVARAACVVLELLSADAEEEDDDAKDAEDDAEDNAAEGTADSSHDRRAGANVIAHMLATHQADASITVPGCRLLARFARGGKFGCPAGSAQRGVEIILALLTVLLQHMADPTIAALFCGTLANMTSPARGQDDARAAIAAVAAMGGLDAVVKATATHSAVPSIGASARAVFENVLAAQ